MESMKQYLLQNFLLLKTMPRSWGTNTWLAPPNLKIGDPVSPGPYGCWVMG